MSLPPIDLSNALLHDAKAPLDALEFCQAYISSEDAKVLHRESIRRLRHILKELRRAPLQVAKVEDKFPVEKRDNMLAAALLISEYHYFSRKYPKINLDLNIQENCFHLLVEIQTYTFKRILQNILENSIEAFQSNNTQNHLKIIIELFQQQGALVVSISDNGPGIDWKLREIVLKKGITSKTETTSNGQGLAFVKNATESVGGLIEIHSNSSGGATFLLKFSKYRGLPNFLSPQKIYSLLKKKYCYINHTSELIPQLFQSDVEVFLVPNLQLAHQLVKLSAHVGDKIYLLQEAINRDYRDTFPIILESYLEYSQVDSFPKGQVSQSGSD